MALQSEPNLQIERGPGTILSYLSFNTRDPLLRDVRVRQAIACAIDRGPLLQYIWRGFAQPASSVLPPQSWAYDPSATGFTYDPEKARKILDAAGYRLRDGVRFHLTMKTSTEESTRLLAAVLQQQLRDVGIALDIRTYEFATFLGRRRERCFPGLLVALDRRERGSRYFRYRFYSNNFPPAGRNRSFYSNPRIDSLIDHASRETDQNARKRLYAEVQEILAHDVPSINLWYFDNVLVHTRRVRNLTLNPSGNYDFLKMAEIGSQ